MKYHDYLELDTQAGLLTVKDNQGRWHTYYKGGVHQGLSPGITSPPSIQVMPDGTVQVVTENNVRSAPEVIVVAILPDKTASEYNRER